jgi:hypothetical protein
VFGGVIHPKSLQLFGIMIDETGVRHRDDQEALAAPLLLPGS